MAGKIFSCADFHFLHKKIFKPRGFDTQEEHDWAVFKSIMDELSRGDSLIAGGDLAFAKGEVVVDFLESSLKRYRQELKIYDPTKPLIPNFTISVASGNHDGRGLLEALREAKWIVSHDVVVERVINNTKVVFSHIPMHPICLDRWNVNVHGHLHNDIIPNDDRFINVSWEQYRKPVLVSELLSKVAL